jgi:succinate dehydrogenase / fumarate reductase flavoprotein subunit
MLVLARVIVQGAILRDESRGSHYKPDFPERDDEKFMKTTMASFDAASHNGPKITYKDVDASLLKPRKRNYTGEGAKVAPAAAPRSEAPATPTATA